MSEVKVEIVLELDVLEFFEQKIIETGNVSSAMCQTNDMINEKLRAYALEKGFAKKRDRGGIEDNVDVIKEFQKNK